MRRQKNTQHMKEQDKNPPDLTNEEEIGSLHEKEFRIMIVKMIQNLGNRIEKMQETFNKDLNWVLCFFDTELYELFIKFSY